MPKAAVGRWGQGKARAKRRRASGNGRCGVSAATSAAWLTVWAGELALIFPPAADAEGEVVTLGPQAQPGQEGGLLR